MAYVHSDSVLRAMHALHGEARLHWCLLLKYMIACKERKEKKKGKKKKKDIDKTREIYSGRQ